MHIPFPPAELFMQLPRRAELLRGMLGADLVGFQTTAGARQLRPARQPRCSARPPARRRPSIEVDGRMVRAGAFPISIDVDEMEELARRPGRDPRGPRSSGPTSATPSR